jgi:RNA polymerase sigma-70 factor (family 1)
LEIIVTYLLFNRCFFHSPLNTCLEVNHLSSYGDEHLVQFLRDEDSKAAFAELYNRYWKRLLINARFHLGSEQEAEEVVQNVFMNIWKARQKLELKNTFATYISSCVKYETMAALAKQKRRSAAKLALSNIGDVAEFNTINSIDYESTRKKLEATIQTLPEKCQLVFRLSREEGFTEKQIAGELGISTKTVQAHITKALKVLRTNLQQLMWTLF